ncbi:MAG: flavodoxin family protein [Coprobacillaceae bacterium]
MKIAIRYYSKGGNTKKLAEAISTTLQVPAQDINIPLEENTDILFLGGAIYAGKVSQELAYFIEKLTPEAVKKVFVFGSSVSNKTVYSQIQPLLKKKEVTVGTDYFNCKGKFLLAFPSHPNQEDCNNIKEFVKTIIEKEGN